MSTKDYGFRLIDKQTRDMVWRQLAYYDLETATVEELATIGGARNAGHETRHTIDLLDIRTAGITSFALMIPVSLKGKGADLLLWRPSLRKFCEDENVVAIEQEIHSEKFVAMAYYSEQRGEVLPRLTGILANLGANLKKAERGLKICGYNNSRFDDLIFDGCLEEERMLHRYYIYNDKSETPGYEKTKIAFMDLLPWADAYGVGGGLVNVGKWVGYAKGSRKISTPEEMLAYNIRDVTILPRFVRKINKIHERMGSPCLDAFTPASGSRYFVASKLRNYIAKTFFDGEITREKFPKLRKLTKERQEQHNTEIKQAEDYRTYVNEHPELYKEGKRYLESGSELPFYDWIKSQDPEPYDPMIFSSIAATQYFNLFGGRTEAFWAEADAPYYLDVNSLYPAIEAKFLFPGIERDKNHFRISEEKRHLEISERSVHRITDAGIIHDSEMARKFREGKSGTYISTLAKNTYESMEIITRYFAKLANGGWDKSTPERLGRVIEPLFLDNKLFFGTAWVKITGVKNEFKDYAERICRYFPFPRKVGTFTTFSFHPGGIYQIQFYEVAFLALFDWHFVCFTTDNGFIDQTRKPVRYTPSRFPIAEAMEELYKARAELKRKSKAPDITEDEKALLDSEQRGIKRLLNAGYGILATKNHGRYQRVVSDAGIDRLFSPTSSKTEIHLPRIEGEEPEKEATAEIYNELMGKWRAEGTPSLFFTTLPSGKNVRVRAMYNGGKGLARYFILEDMDNQAKYAQNSLPCWGLAITSGARFTLNSYILNAVFVPGYEVYYCDTDSIMCNEAMYTGLFEAGAIGTELGQLKNEHPDPNHGTAIQTLLALAPKSYVLVMRDGEIIPTLKGTGAVAERTIHQQGLARPYISYTRKALDPNNPQKRSLVWHEEERAYIFDPTPTFRPGTPAFKTHTDRVLNIVRNLQQRAG